MKNKLLLLFLLITTSVKAQDYVVCSQINEYGDFEKAKSCLASLKSKYPVDRAFYFYSMHQAISSGDSVNAKNIFETLNTLPPSDIHVLAGKTIYFVYVQNLDQAKSIIDPVMKNHKLAPVPVLLETARSFIRYKTKDQASTLFWLNILEKELKMPHSGVYMLRGDYYASLGDQGNALNFYNKVLDVEPSNALANYKKAIAYRRIKNAEAALFELDAALKSKAEFPLAILEKGEVLFELNRPDEGMVFYNQYFEKIPGDLVAHLQLGSALFSNKKYAEAEKEADYVLQKDSLNISALKLKSYTSFELGRYPEGLTMLQNFISNADSTTVTSRDYEFLARYHQKAGADSLAIEAFKKALTYPGARSELFSEAGSLMVKKANYNDAVLTYQKKLEQFNGSSADYFNYGRSALALENYLLADSLFAKVIEMQPTWPNGYQMRANTNSHLDPGSTQGMAFPFYEKYVELAEADTANSIKYKSGLIEAYKYLGYYHYLGKNIDKSKFYWRKVLALDPEDKQAKDVLKQL